MSLQAPYARLAGSILQLAGNIISDLQFNSWNLRACGSILLAPNLRIVRNSNEFNSYLQAVALRTDTSDHQCIDTQPATRVRYVRFLPPQPRGRVESDHSNLATL